MLSGCCKAHDLWCCHLSVSVLQIWIAMLMFSSMLTYLLAGFELGLYDPSEYGVVFWYCAYLTKQKQSLLAQHMKMRPRSTIPAKPQKNKKKGKHKGDHNDSEGVQFSPGMHTHSRSIPAPCVYLSLKKLANWL